MTKFYVKAEVVNANRHYYTRIVKCRASSRRGAMRKARNSLTMRGFRVRRVANVWWMK